MVGRGNGGRGKPYRDATARDDGGTTDGDMPVEATMARLSRGAHVLGMDSMPPLQRRCPDSKS